MLQKQTGRILSLLIAVCLVLTMMPLSVFAEGAEPPNDSGGEITAPGTTATPGDEYTDTSGSGTSSSDNDDLPLGASDNVATPTSPQPDDLDADAVEVVDLAAREDGGDDLVFFGRGQDEQGMGGRLLECLEEGVEGRRREHVHLVDDVDAVFSDLGRDAHLVGERADVLDRVVGGGVQLVDVHRAILLERPARLALATRLHLFGTEAVDGLGEDTRAGGLAHAPRAAEEVCVGQLAACDGVFEGRGDVLLPDHRAKRGRAVFSGGN